MKNANLHKAKKSKNDEFYTLIKAIEKELQYYQDHIKNKIIYCNCDLINKSNFVVYFNNIKDKIEKLNVSNGLDFRSEKSIKLLKESDIVVTNPPFSLFREYVAQLIKYNKKFLILGNQNAITYKEIFSLIKENKIWLGVNDKCSSIEFEMPSHYPLIGNAWQDINGKKFTKVNGTCWFTNLEHKKRNEKLILYKKYYGNEKEYPNYDNYNAINIDKVADIPEDYMGVMGVPITFMLKYNPEQFEIISLGIVGSIKFTCNKKMEILRGKSAGKLTYNAKGTLYKKYNFKKDKYPAFKNVETNELYSSIYTRIIVKRSSDKKHYSNEKEYPKYDNYDAINIDKVADIPEDYMGVMGVPITFMHKYNPEQFEIIGKMSSTIVDNNNYGYPFINNKKIYARLLIKRK